MALTFKNIIEKIKKPFQQGLNAKEVVKAIIISLLFTVFPIFGVTTFILTFIAIKFKLNLPIMVVISYLASPLQFLFFLPFIRFGENLMSIEHTLLTVDAIKKSFDHSFFETISQLFFELLCGLSGWLIIALPVSFILLFVNNKINIIMKKKSINRTLLLVSFFLMSISSMNAQTCCSGGVPLSNNLGLPNEGKGMLSMGLNYDYNNLNTLNAGKEKLDDDSRQRITNSVLLNLGYAFTDKLAIETLFTWVNQTRTITQFGNEVFTSTSGIGDAVFLLKYSVPNILGKRTLINFGVGTKVPLGKSDINTEQGIQLTADLQPGSGAWDGLGWLSISKNLNIRPSATVSGSLTYRATGVNNSYLNNSATYEFGDELQANMGYTDQFFLFNTLINPGLVFKYRKAFEDKIDDQGIPNTGGEWIFIRPELTVKLSQNINFITRFELPIYSFVEGTQLTPTTRLTTGLSFKLKTKKELLILNN